MDAVIRFKNTASWSFKVVVWEEVPGVWALHTWVVLSADRVQSLQKARPSGQLRQGLGQGGEPCKEGWNSWRRWRWARPQTSKAILSQELRSCCSNSQRCSVHIQSVSPAGLSISQCPQGRRPFLNSPEPKSETSFYHDWSVPSNGILNKLVIHHGRGIIDKYHSSLLFWAVHQSSPLRRKIEELTWFWTVICLMISRLLSGEDFNKLL